MNLRSGSEALPPAQHVWDKGPQQAWKMLGWRPEFRQGERQGRWRKGLVGSMDPDSPQLLALGLKTQAAALDPGVAGNEREPS